MATINRSKFSEKQSRNLVAVDVLALSPRARRQVVPIVAPITLVVQNTSKTVAITSPSSCKVVSAYVQFSTVPAVAGGTATLKIERIATDGSTATSIVDAATILSGYSNNIAVAQTIAATNPTEITAGQTIRVTVTTSNNVVGTADVGGTITLLVEPVEQTAITDSDV